MKHISALIVKFIMVAVVLGITLSILTALTLTDILYISAAVTVIAYILGDLIILPISNNTVATIADAGLAFATIYMFNYIWGYTEISVYDALIAAAVLGMGEALFHKYVARNVLPERKKG